MLFIKLVNILTKSSEEYLMHLKGVSEYNKQRSIYSDLEGKIYAQKWVHLSDRNYLKIYFHRVFLSLLVWRFFSHPSVRMN